MTASIAVAAIVVAAGVAPAVARLFLLGAAVGVIVKVHLE